jgi:hypothetical protein
MKSLYTYTLLLFVSFLLTNCNKEVSLDTTFEPQLFIFGNLTNHTEKLKITIQQSVPVENTSSQPKTVNNATILLYTEDQKAKKTLVTSVFSEQNGVYESNTLPTPIIGNLYWIEVELDNVVYTSEKERLGSVVVIDEISSVDGYIRATFKDPVNENNFYRLEITALKDNMETSTYQLTDDILFDGNNNAFIEETAGLGLSDSHIHARLINFNYTTYQFYLNMIIQEESQSDDGGGDLGQLFALPPVHITGNITNTNTKRKILGNFGVVSINTKDKNL